MNGSDAATLAFYDTEAPVYRASGAGGVNRWLEPFMAALNPAARVLDLGCGGGLDAAAMLARKFDVDATDGSRAVAMQAEQRLGRPVRVMLFEELDAVACYDGIWASASLLHVPLEALPSVLARVHTALKPGGVHVATYKAMGAAARDAAGRYFNHPDIDTLRACYRRAGDWTNVTATPYVGGGYDGGTSGPWLHIMLRRAS